MTRAPVFNVSRVGTVQVMDLADAIAVLHWIAQTDDPARYAELAAEMMADALDVHVCDDARALDLS